MSSTHHVDKGQQLVGDLIELLHQGASPEEFAQRLSEAEALPAGCASKTALVETVRKAMAVRNRLELQQQRERGMLAVIESAQDLSSRLDLTDVLRAIVSRARNLLVSHLGWLSIYDRDRNEFKVLVADGALAGRTSCMVALRDRGVASIVMSIRRVARAFSSQANACAVSPRSACAAAVPYSACGKAASSSSNRANVASARSGCLLRRYRLPSMRNA